MKKSSDASQWQNQNFWSWHKRKKCRDSPRWTRLRVFWIRFVLHIPCACPSWEFQTNLPPSHCEQKWVQRAGQQNHQKKVKKKTKKKENYQCKFRPSILLSDLGTGKSRLGDGPEPIFVFLITASVTNFTQKRKFCFWMICLPKAPIALSRTNRCNTTVLSLGFDACVWQECERHKCERHQCECQQCERVNSANETRVPMSNVRMPTVRKRQHSSLHSANEAKVRRSSVRRSGRRMRLQCDRTTPKWLKPCEAAASAFRMEFSLKKKKNSLSQSLSFSNSVKGFIFCFSRFNLSCP